jgi:hypothetical protein
MYCVFVLDNNDTMLLFAEEQEKKKGVCSCEPCLKKSQIRKKQEATVKPVLM